MRWLLVLLFPGFVYSQGSPLFAGHPAYPVLDRLEILQGRNDFFHASLKYTDRQDVVAFVQQLDSSLQASHTEAIAYILADNAEWVPDSLRVSADRKPLLRHFYRSPAAFFEVRQPGFFLQADPLLRMNAGWDPADAQPLFENSRGFVVRGGIDDRLYFSVDILESQARFPAYVRQWVGRNRAIPGAGLYKTYQSTLFNITDGYDFLNSQSFLAFRVSPHVGVQLGYGRNFLGQGYRSLLLSDVAANHLFLKLNWRVWKLHYQNLFAELGHTSPVQQGGLGLVPKKYLAGHHLSMQLRHNLNVGIFEAVVFERDNFFELNYLNPFILYRSIEGALGSPDNVLIGLDARWNVLRRLQVYGQLMLDEFKFDELFLERRGWWANKYAFQLGLKWINALGVDKLDMNLEYNQARPYTYTHRDSSANYAHFNQPLAHPLGAGFRESVLLLRYQPVQRWLFETRLIHIAGADDPPGQNQGNNILLSYLSRAQDYNNRIGQGIGYKALIVGADLSYQIRHNVFLDLSYFYRKKDSADDTRDNLSRFVSAGIRANIGRNRFDF